MPGPDTGPRSGGLETLPYAICYLPYFEYVFVYSINGVLVVISFAILSYNHNFYAISNFVLPASYEINKGALSLGVKFSQLKPDN